MELSEETKQDLIEFQNIQQQLQMVLMQKQQLQMQIAENRKVEEELAKHPGEAYRFTGTVLIAKKADELNKELASERETLEMRKGVIEKQEGKLSERLSALENKFRKMQASMGGEGASVGAGPSITKKGKAN